MKKKVRLKFTKEAWKEKTPEIISLWADILMIICLTLGTSAQFMSYPVTGILIAVLGISSKVLSRFAVYKEHEKKHK